MGLPRQRRLTGIGIEMEDEAEREGLGYSRPVGVAIPTGGAKPIDFDEDVGATGGKSG